MKKYLKDNIKIKKEVRDWKEAIEESGKILLEKNKIEKRYIEKIIEKVKELGFYIVLSEDVAMPHSRPEDGVKELGVSLLKLDKGVKFGDTEIQIIVTLAATDNNSHIDILKDLMELFADEEKIEKIKNAKTEDEILDIV